MILTQINSSNASRRVVTQARYIELNKPTIEDFCSKFSMSALQHLINRKFAETIKGLVQLRPGYYAHKRKPLNLPIGNCLCPVGPAAHEDGRPVYLINTACHDHRHMLKNHKKIQRGVIIRRWHFPKPAHPIVAELYTAYKLRERKLSATTIYNFSVARRSVPSISVLAAIADELGFEIVLRRKQ